MKNVLFLILLSAFQLQILCAAEAAFAEKQNVPKIAFQSIAYDFGRIGAGEIITHDFIFTNVGTATLHVTDVHPACGCTTAGTWDAVVEPGKTGRIPLQFNSIGFSGKLTKTATVASDDPQNPTSVLQLSGEIWKAIEVTPALLVLNAAAESNLPVSNTVKIINNTKEALSLLDLACTNTSISLDLKTIKPGVEFDLAVTARPPFDASRLFSITARTTSPTVPELKINAYLGVQAPVIISPPQILLGASRTNTAPILVSIRNFSPNPVTVSDAAVNIPDARVEIREVQHGQLYNLALTLPPGFSLKDSDKPEITAATSHPKFPRLAVPILSLSNPNPAPVSREIQELVPRARVIARRPTSTNQATLSK